MAHNPWQSWRVLGGRGGGGRFVARTPTSLFWSLLSSVFKALYTFLCIVNVICSGSEQPSSAKESDTHNRNTRGQVFVVKLGF